MSAWTSGCGRGAAGVFAVGDLVATPQLAHVGFAEAILAVKQILGERAFPVDYGKVPWAIYCHPEVAFVGMTEQDAADAGIETVTKRDPFGGNSRARILGETDGLVKVICEKQAGRRRRPPARCPHGRPMGDRAARAGLSVGELGSHTRRDLAFRATTSVALRNLWRDCSGSHGKGSSRCLTSRCRSSARPSQRGRSSAG